MPNLVALATANPPMYVTQREAFEFYDAHFELEPEERELYRKVLIDGPIDGRYIGVDRKVQVCDEEQDLLIARFLKFGRLMATRAARQALDRAELAPDAVDGLVVNTCTGYLCPGLSSYVAQDLGLRTDVRVLDLMGMGCGGAVPNWEAATGMLARSECGPVLSIAVEVCTATIFMGPEPDLVVSNCIFGDGAAAAVLERPRDGREPLLRVVDFQSGLFPRYREDLRYRSVNGRLRNSLSRRVPVLGGRTISEVAGKLLARHDLEVADIDWWAVHAGGSRVLDQVEKQIGLSDGQLRFSRGVLKHYGNMSSPTCLFVLDEILSNGRPRPGEWGLVLSFGAGFTAFAALVEF
jgi:alkylresorcinol/alkylpyrone synthase